MAGLTSNGYVSAVLLAATVLSAGTQSLAFCNDDILSLPDTSYISVGFFPYVRSLGFLDNSIFYEYTDEDVQAMLQVVSTRFNKMNTYIGAPNNHSTNFSLTISTDPPIVAAKMNKKANSLVLQVSANYLGLPSNINQNSMDYILNVVSAANGIYPGTVSRVIIYLNGTITENNVHQVDLTNFLQSLHTSLTRVNVKLGLRLWLQDCDASEVLSSPTIVTYNNEAYFINPPELPERFSLPATTKTLLRHTDFVIFRPKNVYNFRNAEKTFQFLEQVFSKCEKAVEHEEEITTHLEFSWPSDGDETEKPYYLVKYWKLLGAWAAERKQDVFIDEAFDSPIKQIILNKASSAHLGWWRLADLNNPNITTTTFVEKLFVDDLSKGNEDVPVIPEFEFKDVPSSNKNWHKHYAFAGGSIFIVVFLVVARIMCRFGLTRTGSQRDDQHYLIT